jgi:hypothetical protein
MAKKSTGIGNLLQDIQEKEQEFREGEGDKQKPPKEEKTDKKPQKPAARKEMKKVVEPSKENGGIIELFSKEVKPENDSKTNVLLYREQWSKFKILADALNTSQLNIYSVILERFYQDNEKEIRKVIEDYYKSKL